MKKTAFILSLIAFSATCVTFNRDYKLGVDAEMSKNYEQAVSYYQKAALKDPNEPVYRLAFARARASASLYYLQNARVLAGQGRKEEALAAYRKAAFFDPANRMIPKEMKSLEEGPAEKAAAPELSVKGPVSLRAGGEKLNLAFRTEVSVKSIFQDIGRMAGISFVFDEQFRDTFLAVDLAGKEVEQAVGYLCAVTRNFYRVIDERSVLIAPDNVQKRQQYELNAIKTFYLSNIDAQDLQQQLIALMRSVYKAPNIQVDKTLNSLTVRDSPQVVEMVARLLRRWDKPRGEVLIEVEIMEVTRQRLQQLGLDFGLNVGDSLLKFRLNPVDSGSTDPGWFRIQGLDLTDMANYELSVPNALLQFLGSDSDTRIIAQPRFRGIGGEEIRYLVGQKVPIPQSTFTPIAAGGLNTQPIVNYTQQDVGIEINLKPRIHMEKEVTLEVDIKISSIAGTGIADIPIIATREVKNTIRLKDGETNLLAGLLRDEERQSLTGIPGLKDIPLLGRLFSSTEMVVEKTDVILTMTPHIIRPMEISEEDLKPLWLEPDSLAGVSAAGGARLEEAYPLNKGEEPGAPPAEREPGQNSVYLSPAGLEVPAGREFNLNVEISSVTEIANLSLVINFNSALLQLKDAREGGLLKQMGDNVPFLKSITGSSCTLGFSKSGTGGGFKGRGTLAVLAFSPVGRGEATVTVDSISALSSDSRSVKLGTGQARILIR